MDSPFHSPSLLDDFGDIVSALSRLDAPSPQLSLDTTLISICEHDDIDADSIASSRYSVAPRRAPMRTMFTKLKQRASVFMLRRPTASATVKGVVNGTSSTAPRLSLTFPARDSTAFPFGASTPCLPSQVRGQSDATSPTVSLSSTYSCDTRSSSSTSPSPTLPAFSSRWSTSTASTTSSSASPSSTLSHILAKPLPILPRRVSARGRRNNSVKRRSYLTPGATLPKAKPAPTIPLPGLPSGLGMGRRHPYAQPRSARVLVAARNAPKRGRMLTVPPPPPPTRPPPPPGSPLTIEHGRRVGSTFPVCKQPTTVTAPAPVTVREPSTPPQRPRPRTRPARGPPDAYSYCYPSQLTEADLHVPSDSPSSITTSSSSSSSQWSDPGLWLASSIHAAAHISFSESLSSPPSSFRALPRAASSPALAVGLSRSASNSRRFGYVPPHPHTPVRTRSRTRPRAYSFGPALESSPEVDGSPATAEWHSACSSF